MSLKKFEIINRLQQEYGITVKSVQELNKILEKMNLLKHLANGWETTKEGLKYSIYHSQGLNADLWHDNIVQAIALYLKKK